MEEINKTNTETEDLEICETDMRVVNATELNLFRGLTPSGESVNMPMSALEVGGRNYVLGSEELRVFSPQQPSGYYGYLILTPIETGVYMITADVEVVRGGATQIQVATQNWAITQSSGGAIYNIVNGKIKGVYRCTNGSIANRLLMYSGTHASANNDVIFSNIKLERGVIASDWTPAPEDKLNNITPSLTEQATGEIWDEKPVYVRMFKGTLSEILYYGFYITILGLFGTIIEWTGVIGKGEWHDPYAMPTTDVSIMKHGAYGWKIIGSAPFAGKNYTLIVKYTKP